MQEFLVEAPPKDTLDVIEAEMQRAGYNTHGIPGRRSETSVTFTRPGGCLTGLFTDAPSAKFVASPPYSGERSVTRLTLETNDEADRASGHRIVCPLLALWSAKGPLDTWYEEEGGLLSLWRAWGDDVRGHALNAGHFFPEEAPEQTADALNHFFSAAESS